MAAAFELLMSNIYTFEVTHGYLDLHEGMLFLDSTNFVLRILPTTVRRLLSVKSNPDPVHKRLHTLFVKKITEYVHTTTCEFLEHHRYESAAK